MHDGNSGVGRNVQILGYLCGVLDQLVTIKINKGFNVSFFTKMNYSCAA